MHYSIIPIQITVLLQNQKYKNKKYLQGLYHAFKFQNNKVLLILTKN